MAMFIVQPGMYVVLVHLYVVQLLPDVPEVFRLSQQYSASSSHSCYM